MKKLSRVLITDCGSTTTKALLFERVNGELRHTFRGESATTVEAPIADVTVGAFNAFRELEELSGYKLINDNGSLEVDKYLSTSSAGGGLQMVVLGMVKEMTAASAARAALGAGALVLDVFTHDDPRSESEIVRAIKQLKPDIILLAGGVDGGAKAPILESAEILIAASPRPRFGDTLKTPVIFAGNKDVAKEVTALLEERFAVTVLPNIRPTLEEEHLKPARDGVHELFLSHVMSHSPGYDKLLKMTSLPIVPTPAAVGYMVLHAAKKFEANILCVDIGGATTDVFSCFGSKSFDSKKVSHFNRTVSANLGMSYSIGNVLLESGIENILRWLKEENLGEEINREGAIDHIRNKMIRPTTMPHTLYDLKLEQAVCREALRLSFNHHIALSGELVGVKKARFLGDVFRQGGTTPPMSASSFDMVIGSGGVLSHAPNRLDSALMLLEGMNLQGVFELVVDSIFMLPHLGALLELDTEGAHNILEKDCLIRIALGVVPINREANIKELGYGVKKSRAHKQSKSKICTIAINEDQKIICYSGDLQMIPLTPGITYSVTITPEDSEVDFGHGKGVEVRIERLNVSCGIIFDGR
jgi:uncharacterized protein (TIGR01319 family)